MAIQSSFFLNCYCHWSLLVLRNGNVSSRLMQIREVVTQGELFNMVAYDIGILLLTKLLKSEYPDITQPWYVGDADALGIFASIELYFNRLK